MASPAENFFRFLGATETADRIAGPRLGMLERDFELRESDLRGRQALRNMQLEEMQHQRALDEAGLQQAQARQTALGNIFRTPGINPAAQGPVQPGAAGISPDQMAGLIESGVGLGDIGALQQMFAPPEPTKLEEQLQTLAVLGNLPQDVQEQYASLYGKGGTTVNVGDQMDPFAKKFSETQASELGKEIGTLRQEATDFISQAGSAEQALNILRNNPNIEISPTAGLTAQVKEFFAPFLDPEQLEGVADYRTLESQLIRNRFDVTKVLKGAITEQEQAAAQQVAGSATGTRLGLEKTLLNNIAYATLAADYRQRKADYIRQQGPEYSPQKFEAYYKALGEAGERPTLNSLLEQGAAQQPNTRTTASGISYTVIQ